MYMLNIKLVGHYRAPLKTSIEKSTKTWYNRRMKVRMKSFFDEENRMKKISKIGDPLEILNSIIKWEMFREILKKYIVRKESNKGGRPPFDVVMMFKILVTPFLRKSSMKSSLVIFLFLGGFRTLARFKGDRVSVDHVVIKTFQGAVALIGVLMLVIALARRNFLITVRTKHYSSLHK